MIVFARTRAFDVGHFTVAVRPGHETRHIETLSAYTRDDDERHIVIVGIAVLDGLGILGLRGLSRRQYDGVAAVEVLAVALSLCCLVSNLFSSEALALS